MDKETKILILPLDLLWFFASLGINNDNIDAMLCHNLFCRCAIIRRDYLLCFTHLHLQTLAKMNVYHELNDFSLGAAMFWQNLSCGFPHKLQILAEQYCNYPNRKLDILTYLYMEC